MTTSTSRNMRRCKGPAAGAVLALLLCVAPAAAQDPVLVPALPSLAPAGGDAPSDDLGPLRGATAPPPPLVELLPDPAPAPDADTTAPVETAEDDAPLRTIPEEYRPVMVEALAETAGPAAAEEIGTALGQMDLEALRIIARMSPEQIDALTLLILSQTPEGALPDTLAPGDGGEEARWVGDWEKVPEAAPDIATAPAPEDADTPWTLRETEDGRLLISHLSDPLSRLEIEPGMVLGHFGRITRIRRLPAHVEVETASGTTLRGPREGAVIALAPVPTPPPQAVTPQPEATVDLPPAEENRVAALSPRPRPDRANETDAAAADTGILFQAASFKNRENALGAVDMLDERGLAARIEPARSGGLYRLLVGPVPDAETKAALAILSEVGFGDAFPLSQPVSQ